MLAELTEQQRNKLVIVGGDTHPELSAGIASAMDLELGALALKSHPNGLPYVRFDESVRGKHVMVIQPHGRTADMSAIDSLHQQFEIINAAVLSKAGLVTAVCPSFAGDRQDRQSQPRESVSIGLNLQLLKAAGATALVTVDIHERAALAAFDRPYDNLTAQPLLRQALAATMIGDKSDYVVVAPDEGHSKDARRHGRSLGLDVILMTKDRDPSGRVIRSGLVSGVEGKTCFMLDDQIDTAGTLESASRALEASGVKAVYIAATHAWLSEPAVERLRDAEIIKGIYVTDTLPIIDRARQELGDRLHIVTVKDMMAQSLKEIVTAGSVSDFLHRENFS